MRTFENVDPMGGPREIWIGDQRLHVEHGKTIEVPEEVADGLAAQTDVWREVKPKSKSTKEEG